MDRITQAMQKIQRRDFLPTGMRLMASQDAPLPIGHHQTNSQPATVRRMLEWLDVQSGHKVLDVGSGSGWTSALLAELTGPTGSVDAVELVPELLEFGRRNCLEYDFQNLTFHLAGPRLGLPDNAPYDRILVSASADGLPGELLEQLAISGKLVIPVWEAIWVIENDPAGNVTQTSHPGYHFVPLVTGDGRNT